MKEEEPDGRPTGERPDLSGKWRVELYDRRYCSGIKKYHVKKTRISGEKGNTTMPADWPDLKTLLEDCIGQETNNKIIFKI